MNNQVMVIHPYLDRGTWKFDDKATGLKGEAFVLGMSEMISAWLKKLGLERRRKFKLTFSKDPFPGYSLRLRWVRSDMLGNWYYAPTLRMYGWLCPALFKYFVRAPMNLYASASPLTK